MSKRTCRESLPESGGGSSVIKTRLHAVRYLEKVSPLSTVKCDLSDEFVETHTVRLLCCVLIVMLISFPEHGV